MGDKGKSIDFKLVFDIFVLRLILDTWLKRMY